MKRSLEDIKKTAESLAKKINAPLSLLPAFGGFLKETEVTLDENGHLYYVTRGDKGGTEYHICFDEDDLLYKFFNGITGSMAYEMIDFKNIDIASHRKAVYAKQEELFSQLNPEWRKRNEEENIQKLKY